jgi:hypothetical protein
MELTIYSSTKRKFTLHADDRSVLKVVKFRSVNDRQQVGGVFSEGGVLCLHFAGAMPMDLIPPIGKA